MPFSKEYGKRNRSNIIIVLMLFIIGIIRWGLDPLWSFVFTPKMLTIIVISGTFFHEYIHKLGLHFFGQIPWSKIFFLKRLNLIPLSTTWDNDIWISIYSYQLAVLLPSILLGYLPFVIGIFFGKMALTKFGYFMIVFGVGDLVDFWTYKRYKKIRPGENGFEIF